MIRENGIETCILLYVKQIASPSSIYQTGCSGLVHWDDPEGWDGEGSVSFVKPGLAPCFTYGDTRFTAILSNHPTLALSHRVQKTVLHICVSFAVSYIGSSLPSFWIPYICISILYWCFSSWLTSFCIIDSKRNTDVKNSLLDPWKKARVGWFERIALKHVYYHMLNRLPVQVQCMR